jgi:hypothetical protein
MISHFPSSPDGGRSEGEEAGVNPPALLFPIMFKVIEMLTTSRGVWP